MKKRFYQFHRKVAIWLALPVILWALSGLLHPMMANWFRPEIAKKFIPPSPIVQQEAMKAPAEVFRDVSELHQVKAVNLGGKPVYLGVTPDQELTYRAADSGVLIEGALEQYVEELARAYADDQDSELLEITKIEEFGSNYSAINRLLPAYRVKLDREDGLEVVVDPRTGRLATFDSPSKRVFGLLFSWFHTWSFLGDAQSPLRITVVLVVSLLVLLVAVSGIASLFLMKRKTERKKVRRWHRLSGGVSAIFFLMFGFSGVAHVAVKYFDEQPTQWVSEQAVPVGELSFSPADLPGKFAKLSLAEIDGSSYYRVAGRDGVNLFSTKTGEKLEDGDEVFARDLALEFSGFEAGAIKETEQISKFRSDYGFIFKRLPVWRVHYEGQGHWNDTVDTEDAHMASRTSAGSLAEALSFVYLHKFHFLDFAGREARDIGSAIAVSLVGLTVVLGVLAYRRRLAG